MNSGEHHQCLLRELDKDSLVLPSDSPKLETSKIFLALPFQVPLHFLMLTQTQQSSEVNLRTFSLFVLSKSL